MRLALVSGVLCALAFPPVGWSWVLVFAPAVSFWGWYRGERVGWLGFWWGVAFALAVSWHSLTTFEQRARVEGVGGVAWALAGLWFAFWYTLAGWWVGRIPARGVYWAVLVACAWIVVNWLRSLGPTGFPWAMLALGVVRAPLWLQPADLGGVWLVEWLIIFWNALLVVWLRERQRAYAVALALLGLLWTGYGLWAMRFYGSLQGDFRVAVVQPRVAVVSSQVENRFQEVSESFVRAAGEQGARWVVFPESYEWRYLREGLPRYWQEWSERYRICPLVGATADWGHGEVNSALCCAPGGASARYNKVKLMAFTEWTPPLGAWLAWLGVSQRDLLAGERLAPLQVSDEPPVGVLICVESLFAWMARAQVRAGAQWLANMSSDTWLQEMALREQYADFCALRAVETRRWVVRSSPVGLTGFCTPTGERMWASPDVRGVWVRAIRPMTHQTPYVRWGDFWVYGCVMVLAWSIARVLASGSSFCGRGRLRAGFMPPSNFTADREGG